MGLSPPIDYEETVPFCSVNDSLYPEYILLLPYLICILDSPEVQRLRSIQQLGVTSSVWPSATHTRFSHSLGVAHLAYKMVTNLRQRQPELDITSRDVACVVIAGLCHDLGHGPWSHVWDDMFIRYILGDNKWSHEQGSEMMFDCLIRNNNINMPLDDQRYIKALIAGNHTRTPKEKGFLFDIVANKTNGLDVDKLDYLLRDCAVVSFGSSVPQSVTRLLQSARVNLKEGHICYDEKEISSVYDVFETRYKMHRKLYNHKTVRAIAYMTRDALIAANEYLQLADAIHHPERYINMTDAIKYQISASTNPELTDSRAIFGRIDRRDLYREACSTLIEWVDHERFQSYFTPGRIVSAALLCSQTMSPQAVELASTLRPSDIIVDFSSSNFGMGERNPVDRVKFYSRDNLDECHQVNPNKFSKMLPSVFCEYRLVVYVKKRDYVKIVAAGYAELSKMIIDKSVAPEGLTVSTPHTTDRL